MASGTRLLSSSIWNKTDTEFAFLVENEDWKKCWHLIAFTQNLRHRMRRTDQWFHMPICRYLHFHDSAVAPPFPNLIKKKHWIPHTHLLGMATNEPNGSSKTKNSPPHSSMRLAIVSASSSAILRILLRPSRTTCTTWASFTVSKLQNGGITCFSIKCATWR